jgi:ribose 5-phosphate isomerase B
MMRIIFGSDERNAMTNFVAAELRRRKYEVQLIGPLVDNAITWPAIAQRVSETVIAGEADEGIVCCWTGTGVSMAANKVPGIRAALCGDAETARGARVWNDANVLCMSLRSTSEAVAGEILEAWFATSYEPNPEDDACLAHINEIEEIYARSHAD